MTHTINITEIPSTPTNETPFFPNSSPTELGLNNTRISTCALSCSSGNKEFLLVSATSVANDQGIFKLSSYTFSAIEKQLLSKGLSFCPSPGECNLGIAKIATDKLHCSLCLHILFSENYDYPEMSDDKSFSHRNFCPHSLWTLPGLPSPSLAGSLLLTIQHLAICLPLNQIFTTLTLMSAQP